MNKIIVKLYVPMIDEFYDVWIPVNKKVFSVIIMLSKGVKELSNGVYDPDKMPTLYNKLTGMAYDLEAVVQDTNIKNGTELIII